MIQTDILAILNLQRLQINDKQFKVLCDGLKSCNSLISLNLSHNDITHVGLRQFYKETISIKELFLSENPIGDQGAFILRDILSKPCTSLHSLIAADCHIKCEGFL